MAPVLPEPALLSIKAQSGSVETLTSLSNADHVIVLENCRDGIGLDGSGIGITAKLDVLLHDRVKTCIVELWMKSDEAQEKAHERNLRSLWVGSESQTQR